MNQETIIIKGMHCQSCVSTIESKIKELDGVESVKVSLLDNNAKVKFNSDKVNLKKINDKIKDAGYNLGNRGGKKKTIIQGIAYGLVPHIGCIGFIIAAILGSTILMQYFRPVLMNRYVFHYLILISLGFAGLSSLFYLRKQKLLSWKGVKRKKGYLLIMFGSVIGINLILFLGVFPMLANVGVGSITGAVIANGQFDVMKISVDIPCPGHAPLITSELVTVEGVEGSEFSFPNKFDVYYDFSQTSEQEILSLEIFDEYPAKLIGESQDSQVKKAELRTPNSGGSCSGGCGGSGSCGGACGSPTCNYNR